MVVVIQRVNFASCEVDSKIVSNINKGLLLFVGFSKEDNKTICEKLSKKLLNLRIFEDENGKMNKSIFQVNGSILVISQFTLTANILNGNRPSFDTCMNPNDAKQLYEYFIKILKEQNLNIQQGVFGEYMKINLLNDGPVTFILDSNDL